MTDKIQQAWALGTSASAVGAGTIAPYTVQSIRDGMDEHPVDIKLYPELLNAIGQVVVHHSVLEWALAGILCLAMGIDRKLGRIAIANPRSGDIAARIKQICLAREIPAPSSLPAEKPLNRLKTKRDLVAHGIWIVDKQSGKLCVQDTTQAWELAGEPESAPKRIYPHALEMDAPRVLAIVDETIALIRATDAATQEMRATLGS